MLVKVSIAVEFHRYAFLDNIYIGKGNLVATFMERAARLFNRMLSITLSVCSLWPFPI